MANYKYHGTSFEFDRPSIKLCKSQSDFGKGFYLTGSLRDAAKMANRSITRHQENKNRLVYIYDFTEKMLRDEGLVVHRFQGADKSWLEFVIKNRNNLPVERYDVVIGPVADAKAQKIIEAIYNRMRLFMSEADIKKAIKLLSTEIYSTQYCFLTDRSIMYLQTRLVEVRRV